MPYKVPKTMATGVSNVGGIPVPQTVSFRGKNHAGDGANGNERTAASGIFPIQIPTSQAHPWKMGGQSETAAVIAIAGVGTTASAECARPATSMFA